MQGYYDGNITIDDLKQNGDTGLGTFKGVNGEMIVLDGNVYQVLGSGKVEKPAGNTIIPFAAVTYFDSDEKYEFSDVKDFVDFTSRLYDIIKNQSPNSFYVIKASGTFKTMYARSELKQEKPYRPLAQALKTDTREFNFENIKGTIVALYCPPYMGDLNSVGFHLHFISDDKTKGGHVFNLSADSIYVELDKTPGFKMVLSDDDFFSSLNLAKKMTKEIEEVEGGK